MRPNKSACRKIMRGQSEFAKTINMRSKFNRAALGQINPAFDYVLLSFAEHTLAENLFFRYSKPCQNKESWPFISAG